MFSPQGSEGITYNNETNIVVGKCYGQKTSTGFYIFMMNVQYAANIKVKYETRASNIFKQILMEL